MLFQRPVTATRQNQLKNFWTKAANPGENESFILGPTAIIVAIQGKLELDKNGQINLDYQCPVDLIKNDEEVVIQELAKLLLPSIRSRLSERQNNSLDSRAGNEFSPFPDIESDYVYEFAIQMQQMIADPVQFIEINKIDQQGIGEIINSMEAVLRPAIIVDGQHRLYGASLIDKDIFLPVVAIPNCTWTEQIYQFVVINEKAQRVDQSLLSDIFGSSLTGQEQEGIRDKLKRSDVEIESRIASVLANRETTSPFRNMIIVKMEGKNPAGIEPYISERTIRALIDGSSQKYSDGWRTSDEFYRSYVQPTIGNRTDWDSWSGKWLEYWFAFWDEVKIFYNLSSTKGGKKATSPLWDSTKQTNLTKAVTLRQLQTLFMRMCVEAMNEIEKSRDVVLKIVKDHDLVDAELEEQRRNSALPGNLDDFRKFVRTEFLERGIEEKVFTASWKTSLDDPSGQEELWEVLSGAFAKHRKGETYYVGGKIFQVKDPDKKAKK